ncbi:MAG: hypothetical protein QOD55_1186 [Solirubrobacteraceae bacterium]|nr:hypothetical protein [Solirubrobacteraceae bacterium]
MTHIAVDCQRADLEGAATGPAWTDERLASIRPVRRPTLAATAAAIVSLALLAAVAAPASAQTPKRTVASEVGGLLAAGAIDQARHDAWRAAWSDANRTLKRLRGARRDNLGAVVETTERIAATGQLTATRAPAVFLTLQRNREWWSTRPLLPAGRRVSFPGSQLVWQAYAGQGIQIQWLGTFGKANGLYFSRSNTALTALLDEAIALATQRAGGIAWEYLFPFDGGMPPWVSGLAQGTGIQALSRAASRLKDPRYFDAARAALGIFKQPPPEGVRVATPAGAHYLQYSFGPDLRILNGFVQALNGLHDFTILSGDPEGAALFTAGEAQLRVEVPAGDTGAWSLYRPGFEADLHYHRLVVEFLRAMCQKLSDDARLGRPAPEPSVYCSAADRFTAYERTPPVLALVAPTRVWRAERSEKLTFTLSKISTVSLTLRRDGRTVFARTQRFGRGAQAFTIRPSRHGALAAEVRAVDLVGNAAPTATATLPVRRAPKRK